MAPAPNDFVSAEIRRAGTLGQLFLKTARTNPDRLALWARGETFTYANVVDRAGAISLLLDKHGIGADDRIAILSERTATAYVAILAALLTGAAYVPLNPRFPSKRNRQILEHSGARALICSEAQREVLSEIGFGLPNLELIILPESEVKSLLALKHQLAADLVPVHITTNFMCEDSPGDLAYLFFTSGTTGVPKGVPISHANVLAYLRGIRTVCDTGPNDRMLQVVDLTFDLSVHDMFLAWTSGACLFSVPENAALLCSRFVAEHRITHWLSVPSTAALIKKAGLLQPGSMPSLRFSFFCGEALTGAVVEAWAGAAPNSAVINIYGPTEATVAFSAFHYQPGQANPPSVVSLGHAFPEQHMELFSPEGERSEHGTGEICLSGSQVMSGYWNAPHLTAERFFEADRRRWYRTGDFGRYVPGEGFAYLGRADRQVKIRGYRVELQEVEAAVRKVTGHDLVAVLPWPVDDSGSVLGCMAFVVGSVDEATALDNCRELLPDYVVPSRILTIEEMPLNANGKVDYHALRGRALALELPPNAGATPGRG